MAERLKASSWKGDDPFGGPKVRILLLPPKFVYSVNMHITFETWLLYLITITAVISSPGPSSLLSAGLGATHGRKYSFYSAMGGHLTVILYLIIAFLSIDKIAQYEHIFNMFKYVAAAYLLYLATTFLKTPQSSAIVDIKRHALNPMDAAKQSAIIGLTNPKDILFFVFLLPHFINVNTYTLIDYVILVITWTFVEIPIITGYGILGENIGKWTSSKYQRYINYVIAGLFTLIACLVLFQ